MNINQHEKVCRQCREARENHSTDRCPVGVAILRDLMKREIERRKNP